MYVEIVVACLHTSLLNLYSSLSCRLAAAVVTMIVSCREGAVSRDVTTSPETARRRLQDDAHLRDRLVRH